MSHERSSDESERNYDDSLSDVSVSFESIKALSQLKFLDYSKIALRN